MGAEQSSYQSGSSNQNGSAVKTCYYEVLGVERQATDDEIKKAYRKKALELHPDRNYGDVENATTKFAEVQSAYEVLSDPQERSWYDSHRDSILRGDGGGPSEDDQFEHNVRLTSARDIVGLIGRFNPRIPFTDGPNGFYGILQDTFAKLAVEENSACDWEDLEAVNYPDFGSSEDDYEDVVKPFYRVWINFSTKKTFSWRDAYRSSDAPDRATRRLIEKENKRLRDEGIREFNDAVRALVAFVRKRDPRFIPNSQTEADRQKILRDAAIAQAARSRAANQAKLDVHVVPDWAKSSPPEGVDLTDSSESEVEQIECVVCGKTFKSENQYETHERSKKHVKAVQQLQREMRKENRLLNLDQLSESESSVPTERFTKLEFVEKCPSDVNDAHPVPANQSMADEAVDDPGFTKNNTQSIHITDSTELRESGIATPEDNGSGSSELDDQYASREDVENRLAGSPSKPNPIKGTSIPNISIDSENDSDRLPKLGKAKAKRAKKAARQQMDIQESSGFKCSTCNNTFPSKTKLFSHIKELDHAELISKVVQGKNKKRRG